MIRILILLILVTALPAQRIWTVHWTPGKGDFTDLPQAVAAAQPGDTIIIIAAWYYTSFSTNKGIRVIAPPSTSTLPGGLLTVHDLPKGQTFSMENFSSSISVTNFSMRLINNKGRVHLDRLKFMSSGSVPGQTRGFMRIEGCDDVFINASTIRDLVIRDSRVSIAQSNIAGNFDIDFPRGIGITGIATDITDSTVTFTGSLVEAAWTVFTVAAAPAIRALRSKVTVAGDSGNIVQSQNAFLSGFSGPAIQADGGTVVLDPDISLVTSPIYIGPPTAGTANYTTKDMPYVLSLSTWSGLDFPVSVHHKPGNLVGLLISLPAAPQPFFLGELWLDPASMFPVGAGTMTGTGNTGFVDLPVPTPAKGFPPGIVFTFQALVLDGQTALLSLPVRTSLVPISWP